MRRTCRLSPILPILPILPMLSIACGVSLPQEQYIEDLRVLEIRAVPPEISIIEPGHTATSAQQLLQLIAEHPNRSEVTLTALAAHPDLDAKLNYEWSRCAFGFADLPCDDEGTHIERISTGTATTSTITLVPIDAFAKDLAESENGTESLASLVGNPRDLFNGLYAFVLLRASVVTATVPVDTQAINAQKRLVIFDPVMVKVAILEARRLVANQMIEVEGIDLPNLCTTVPQAQVDAIFDFLDRREPNRAPVYTDVEYAIHDDAGTGSSTRSLARGELLRLAPSQAVTFRGRARPEDKESYQLIDDNCELENEHETLAWSWFTTRGSLSGNITIEGVDSDAEDAEIDFIAPPEDELDLFETEQMRVRIYSVLRDGRGGSDARTIDIVVDRALAK